MADMTDRRHHFALASVAIVFFLSATTAIMSQGVTPQPSLDRLILAVEELTKWRAQQDREDLGDLDRIRLLEANVKTLQERLAKAESALIRIDGAPAGAGRGGPGRGGGASGGTTPNTEPQIVRAPFEVRDANDQVIFSVSIAPENNQPMAVLGDRSGANVRMLLNQNNGASLGLYDASNALRIGLRASSAESFLIVRNGDKDAVRLIGDETGGTVRVYGGTGTTAGTLDVGKGGTGHFTLSRAQGAVVVEAGATPEGVGQVSASGPRGGGVSTAPGVAHSYIRGWK